MTPPTDTEEPKLVRIAPATGEARQVWERTLEIAKALGSDGWVLVGGLMVQLHGFEREVAVRPTADTFRVGIGPV